MSTAAERLGTPAAREGRPGSPGDQGSRSRAPARRGTDRGAAGLTPYLFLAPYLLLFGVFVLLPLLWGLWISLHAWDWTLPNRPFVGLGNYADLFDPGSLLTTYFWRSMRATLIFTLLSVPLLLTIPLAVALLMNHRFRGRNFFRALYFAPYVLGVAVIGLLWRYLLAAEVGVVNYLLGLAGVEPIPWTTTLPWAWVTLVAVTVWWTLGFNAVIYLAGLQDIPAERYEAAKVDGASAWQRFRNVTVPGLRPILLFIVSTTVLASANMFGQAYLITQGAPANATRTAIYQISDTGLRQFQVGSAAAMSFVLTFFLMLVSLGVFALFRDSDEES